MLATIWWPNQSWYKSWDSRQCWASVHLAPQHSEISANLLLSSSERVAPDPDPAMDFSSHTCSSDGTAKCLGFTCVLQDSSMRPEGSLQLNASSWQCWLHPESHGTRGFNTELWCSSPEGITGAVLWEMDPQHSYSRGCPTRTHLQYTHAEEHGIFTLSHSHSSPANLAVVHSPMLSLTHIRPQTVTHRTWGCFYAS